MKQSKRWHIFLISLVFAVTVYNILPTILFYSQPLKKPVHEKTAFHVANSVVTRVNQLEEEARQWIFSFSKLIGVNPVSVSVSPANPSYLVVNFHHEQEADRFRYFISKAQDYVQFIPKKLQLCPLPAEPKTVILQRNVLLHLDPLDLKDYFTYAPMLDDNHTASLLYQEVIQDRFNTIVCELTGSSLSAKQILSALQAPSDPYSSYLLMITGKQLIKSAELLQDHAALRKRYFSHFIQHTDLPRKDFFTKWVKGLEQLKDQIKLKRVELISSHQQNAEKMPADFWQAQAYEINELQLKENDLFAIIACLQKYKQEFLQGSQALTEQSALKFSSSVSLFSTQTLSLQGLHPFIESIFLDWENSCFSLNLYCDVQDENAQLSLLQQKLLSNMISKELDFISAQVNETIQLAENRYVIHLQRLKNSESFLLLNTRKMATDFSRCLFSFIENNWLPTCFDLQRAQFPLVDETNYLHILQQSQGNALTIFCPTHSFTVNNTPFKAGSIYVVAKGLGQLITTYEQQTSGSASKEEFIYDLKTLFTFLEQQGFTDYIVSDDKSPLKGSMIFECSDSYQMFLRATRENFSIYGSKAYAILEFSNHEQRIATENRIDDAIQDELLQWKDLYQAAQLGLKGLMPFDIPKPTKSAFLNNLKLSFIKYFRGDDRKILKWGLDLSGGKTVQLQLQDHQGNVISNEISLKQAMNELYSRVNKLGVSEVTIRQEGQMICLDFPGSQAISGSDLIEGASLSFHIVNEKFMNNPAFSKKTDAFLQEVWNAALLQGKKELLDIQLIAWAHLQPQTADGDLKPQQTAAAKAVYDAGLRLAHPLENHRSSVFDTSLSQIGYHKNDTYESHPLTILFANYALEGSSLDRIEVTYDPTKGNVLSFGVKEKSISAKQHIVFPQDNLYTWSSTFSESHIQGTDWAADSLGKGWRMAVVLNDRVIAQPMLNNAIKEGASISGNFTQREIAKLENDLRAGSLSFTPKILSETNISPELGAQERNHALIGMICSLVFATVAMLGFYRRAGLISSVTVLFNLLIVWAVLQNIGATLTLSGIAGIILTVAMSVDASVLIFERIKEEYTSKVSLITAVNLGYQRALPAIFDSNMTMLIAAVILLQFDAGPIKGLAVTLIIGILSSLFTSLFASRVLMTLWVDKALRKPLFTEKMKLRFSMNFFRLTRPVILISSLTILLGSYLFITHIQSMVGMDFKGGYAAVIELPLGSQNGRESVEKAMQKAGLYPNEFQVRQLQPSDRVRLFLSHNVENLNRPFYPFSLKVIQDPQQSTDLQINWIATALKNDGIVLSDSALKSLSQNWTSVSGQISDTMKMQAFMGMLSAFIAILGYITVRFEWKYALSATLCLVYDVIFCFSVMAIFHQLGFHLQLDFHTVAALITIIGYSLNDTIIVFDRIREYESLGQNRSLKHNMNEALNHTLSRTLMTSGITLLVLLPLVFLGGQTLFGFAFMLVTGVIFGTFSSLFIAAPLMGWFHQYRLNR